MGVRDPRSRSAGRLVLCRDRFGIKPLFYAQDGGALRFASEIKALLAVMPTPEPDDEVIAGFLLSGADTGEATFFRGIRRLPPAHLLDVPLDDPARAAPRRYWEPPQQADAATGDAAARVRRALPRQRPHPHPQRRPGRDLPERRAGLVLDRLHGATLKADGLLPATYRHQAFGYVPPDAAVSELPWMDLVVERTGVTLDEVRPPPERFEASLQAIARQQDEPFGSTSIAAQWFVFEAARAAGMKVMLDGQGADEVLGGYHGYLKSIAAGLVSDRRPLAYARLALDHRRQLGSWPLPAGTASRRCCRDARARRRASAPALGGVIVEPLERRIPAVEPPADRPAGAAAPADPDRAPVAAPL